MKPNTYRLVLFALVVLLALPSALIILLILKPFLRSITEDERS
ncbi:MAG: hypothetical protein ACOCXF_05250 [bacterium]